MEKPHTIVKKKSIHVCSISGGSTQTSQLMTPSPEKILKILRRLNRSAVYMKITVVRIQTAKFRQVRKSPIALLRLPTCS